jgi:hypothetical protein
MGKLFDLHHNCKQELGYAHATVTTGTTVGEIIDTALFHGVEWFLYGETLTDGVFVVSVLESDDSAMSGSTAVSAAETLGDADFALTDDDTVKRIGSVGKLRYQQLKIVATSAATGGDFSAIAVKFSPFHGPVAD